MKRITIPALSLFLVLAALCLASCAKKAAAVAATGVAALKVGVYACAEQPDFILRHGRIGQAGTLASINSSDGYASVAGLFEDSALVLSYYDSSGDRQDLSVADMKGYLAPVNPGRAILEYVTPSSFKVSIAYGAKSRDFLFTLASSSLEEFPLNLLPKARSATLIPWDERLWYLERYEPENADALPFPLALLGKTLPWSSFFGPAGRIGAEGDGSYWFENGEGDLDFALMSGPRASEGESAADDEGSRAILRLRAETEGGMVARIRAYEPDSDRELFSLLPEDHARCETGWFSGQESAYWLESGGIFYDVSGEGEPLSVGHWNCCGNLVFLTFNPHEEIDGWSVPRIDVMRVEPQTFDLLPVTEGEELYWDDTVTSRTDKPRDRSDSAFVERG